LAEPREKQEKANSVALPNAYKSVSASILIK